MNEQLQRELAAWLGKLREAADAGASFAIEQAPLIVQERLLYGRILYTLTAIAAVVVWAQTYRAVRRVIAMGSDDVEPDVSLGVCGLLSFGFVVMVDAWVGTLIKVWFAPRLYVLEWLANLVK